MFTDRTSESTRNPSIPSMNTNDLMIPKFSKTSPKHFKFQKTFHNFDNSAVSAIQTTKSTENDSSEQQFYLSARSPLTKHINQTNQTNQEFLGREFDGDYNSNNQKILKRRSKELSLNLHSDSILSKNDRNFQHYINYLASCDKLTDDVKEFRYRLITKKEKVKKADENKSIKNDEIPYDIKLVYSPKIMKAVKLKNKRSISNHNIGVAKKDSYSKVPTLKLPQISHQSSKSLSLGKAQTSRGKEPPDVLITHEKGLEEQFKSLLDEILVNYDEFLSLSSKHHQSYEFIKDYLLDKLDFCDIFFNRYSFEFRELSQVRKILMEQIITSSTVNKSSPLLTYKTLSKDSVFFKDSGPLTRVVSDIRPKLDKTLHMRVNLFNQELVRINIERQLREISILGDTMIKRHFDYKKRYVELMVKLYNSNRKDFNNLKNVAETIERDYPIFSSGIMNRIEGFEKKNGEISEINLRNRTIAKSLDNLLIKWTKEVFGQEGEGK